MTPSEAVNVQLINARHVNNLERMWSLAGIVCIGVVSFALAALILSYAMCPCRVQ